MVVIPYVIFQRLPISVRSTTALVEAKEWFVDWLIVQR